MIMDLLESLKLTGELPPWKLWDKIKNNDKNEWKHLIEVFVESKFNIEQTSSKLHIHRNTFKYRLERLRDLLGQPMWEAYIPDIDVLIRLYIYIIKHEQTSEASCERAYVELGGSKMLISRVKKAEPFTRLSASWYNDECIR